MIDIRVIDPGGLAEVVPGGAPVGFTAAALEARRHGTPGQRR